MVYDGRVWGVCGGCVGGVGGVGDVCVWAGWKAAVVVYGVGGLGGEVVYVGVWGSRMFAGWVCPAKRGQMRVAFCG